MAPVGSSLPMLAGVHDPRPGSTHGRERILFLAVVDKRRVGDKLALLGTDGGVGVSLAGRGWRGLDVDRPGSSRRWNRRSKEAERGTALRPE